MSTTATPTAGFTTASRRTATDRSDIPTAAGSSTDRTERRSRPPPDTDGDRVRARLRGERLVADRKSVVEGTSVSVRVDLGGRRIITKENRHIHVHLITTH